MSHTHAPNPEEELQNTDDALVVSADDTAGPRAAVKTTQDVRQGHTGNHVRYILAYSLVGALIALGVVYLVFLR